MRLQAAPDRLDAFAEAGGQMVDDLRLAAGKLGDALDALRAAPETDRFVGDVPPMDVELRFGADRIDLLGQLTASLARRLRDLDDGPIVDASGHPLTVVTFHLGLRRLRPPALEPAWDPARWRETPGGRAALTRVRLLLRPGRWGIPRASLHQLREEFEGLPSLIADAVVDSLTDDQLQRLVAGLEGSWLPGRGLSLQDRHEFWTVVGSRIALERFRRLASFTDDLDPPPQRAWVDPASADAMNRYFWEGMEYRQFDGWLTWTGDGALHAIEPNDAGQGAIGNCALLTAMVALARHAPDRLDRMIRTNASGTFTVTFADGGRVTVSPDFPANTHDPSQPAFANALAHPSMRDTPAGRFELWPMVLEKAFAQREGGWERIVSREPGPVMADLVGGTWNRVDPADVDGEILQGHLDAGRILMLASVPAEHADDAARDLYDRHDLITGKHGYVITAVLPCDRVELHNPWDPEPAYQLSVSLEELAQIGMYIDVSELP